MAKKDYSKLSKEELLEVIKNLESKKKYGLVWDEEKVPEKVVLDCQKQLPVLKEVKEKEIVTDPKQPTHILIEGDNYHALSVLNYTHKGKIDLIYIDPPYNTGNKDFVYNDCYVEKEDTWRHSKWLNFMSKRLELAKDLLTEKGVIFISIDDNEVAQLKLLCDKVFGEENFVGNVVWQRAYSPINLKKTISQNHDFILIYCKQNFQNFELNKLPRTDEATSRYKNPDDDPRGVWKSSDLSVGPAIEKNIYEIFLPSGRKVLPPKGRSWVLSKDRFQEFLKDNRIYFGTKGASTPSIKKFLTEVKDGVVAMTLWTYQEVGHTQDGKRELKEILFENNNPFETVKPLKLLERILKLTTSNIKNYQVLDFFAGSGSSLHAILKLNKEDGGNRECILITNNEKNICEEITYERSKRVINGYKNLKEEQIEGLGGNLKYFKTAFVKNRPNKDQLKIEITKQCTEMLCLKEGIFNLKITTENYKIFEQNNSKENRYMAIFYDFANASLEELKNEMNNLKGNKILYCFTLQEKLETINFKGWKDIQLESIPQKILDLYLEIFKN